VSPFPYVSNAVTETVRFPLGREGVFDDGRSRDLVDRAVPLEIPFVAADRFVVRGVRRVEGNSSPTSVVLGPESDADGGVETQGLL